jgi:hypothetical protein
MKQIKVSKTLMRRVACCMISGLIALACISCSSATGSTSEVSFDSSSEAASTGEESVEQSESSSQIETPPAQELEAWQKQTYDSVDKIIQRPQVNNENRVEILKDLNFSGGFSVGGINAKLEGSGATGYLLYNGKANTEKGSWRVSQWGCSHHMAQEAEFSYSGSVLKYEDAGKTLTVDTAKTGCATLAIRGSEEYSDATLYKNGANGDRNSDENWPHIYLEQDLNYNIDPNAKHLYMELNYKVTECSSAHVTGNTGDGAHAGMFVWFITLTNTDPESESFNQTMWFGIKMYDTRFDGGTPAAEAGGDNGKEDSTGLFIYIPSLTDVDKAEYSEATIPSAVIGQDGVVKFDILTYFPKMFKRLSKLTNPQMKGANIDHLRIGSTNFGWELMGNNDAEVEISYINLYAEY